MVVVVLKWLFLSGRTKWLFFFELGFLFEYEKVFQIIGIVLPTERSIKAFTSIAQSFCLNFKSTFTIFKELMNDFGKDFKRTPHDGCFC